MPLQAKELENLKLALISALDEESVSASKVVCSQHGRDEGIDRNFPADLVVWPRSTEQVTAIAHICHERKIPMIPFGTGTGLESGVSALLV